MSLHSFLHPGATPAPPKRITIRRRLLGRRSRLPAVGVAAGLLSLGLASLQPAHAGTATWHGPTTVTDWYSQPSFWTGGSLITNGFDYPGSGDDAVNSAFNAPMTLGANATVNSFFSNSAFTLNGGTFSGSQANAAGLLTVNNLFTLNGGTINNFTVGGTQQAGGPAASVVVTSANNIINNSIINSNLNMATTAGAFLDVLGAVTENGTISLAGSGNLRLRNDGTALTLGSAGALQGAGTINQFGNTAFTNGGTVNANLATNPTGNTLSLALTNFTNSGLMEATNGGMLTLANTNSANTGAIKAVGAGSVVNITGILTSTGTAAQGNLITASGGGQVQVNGATLLGTLNGVGNTALIFSSGNNVFNGVTSNINLDLVTNAGAFLDILGATTESGTISLAGSGNLRLRNDGTALTLGGGGVLQGSGTFNQFGNTAFTNGGTVNANLATNPTGNTLSLALTTFNNNGTAEATNGGTLALANTNTNNNAGSTLAATGAGSLVTIQGIFTGAGNNLVTASGGGQVQVNGATLLGTLNTDAATALVFNGSGGNIIDGGNSAGGVANINANLNLVTNAGAFLDVLGAATETRTISLAGTGNLRLRNDGTTLTLGSAGILQGSGTVNQFGNTTLINGGTINANLATNPAGNTLSLALTNFTNNSLAEATNGATLSLQNTTTTNSGSLVASGGGVINLASTTFQSNAAGSINTAGGTFNVQGTTVQGTVNGVGASTLVFNGAGGNIFNGVTSNINLDLVTNPGAFLDVLGATTESKTISLAGTGNLRLRNDGTTLTLGSAGLLQGSGTVNQFGNTTLINNGTLNTNISGQTLTTALTSFTNNSLAEATNGATLSLQNTTTTNSGSLVASGGGVINLASTTFQSNAAGSINTAGGTFNVQGTTVQGTVNGVGASTLVFNGAGGNIFNGVTSNINLDLVTNPGAFLDVLGATTESKTISLAGTGNLRLRNDGTTLTLGSAGILQGSGTFNQFGNTAFTNGGTVNANIAGQTLGMALSSFNNNGLAEATNGATLTLANTNTNNSGAVKAVGAGSVVGITGTLTGTGTAAQGNLITASGGGQVQVNGATLLGTLNTDTATALVFNGSGGNIIDGGSSAGGVANINANLDLSTNAGAFLDVLGAATETRTISLAGTGNLRLRNDGTTLTLGSAGILQGSGTVNQFGNTTLNNGGTINANSNGQTLTVGVTNFNNAGTAQAASGATLNVASTNVTNSGTVLAMVGGTVNVPQGLTQTAGLTQVFGVLNASETLNGGTLLGSKTINGNILNNKGLVQPVVGGPGFAALNINGNFSQGSGGELDAFFGNNFHNLLNVSGQTTTGGTLGVFDLDQTQFTGTGSTGSKFTFLNYSGTLMPDGSTVNGFTQYFTNEIPDGNNSGTILGQNGFKYELLNDTANKQLDIQVVTVGAPVPEASTTVSFGILLLLGLGGVVVAARRKKSA